MTKPKTLIEVLHELFLIGVMVGAEDPNAPENASKRVQPAAHQIKQTIYKDLLEGWPEKKDLPKQGSFSRKAWQKYDTDSGYNKGLDTAHKHVKSKLGVE